MPTQTPLISDAAVLRATGRSWKQWKRALDRRGAAKRSHREIVSILSNDEGVGSFWWCQTVATEYEKMNGRRVTGETADARFQVGAQKSLPATPRSLWRFLLSPAGRRLWLGEVARLQAKAGAPFRGETGLSGEIRSVKPAEKLRIRYRTSARAKPTVLQIYLLGGEGKTTLRFHHENLASAAQRERMRRHWKRVLSEIAKRF